MTPERTEPAPQDRPDRSTRSPALDPHHGSSAELSARAQLADPLHVLRLVLDELDQLARRLDQLEQRFAVPEPPE